MTSKRKASLGLGSLGKDDSVQSQPITSSVIEDNLVPKKEEIGMSKGLVQKKMVAQKKKKQILPLYIEPALHEALHTLVFSERYKKTTFQTLFMEGLDLALQSRGLPSVAELASGEKTLNL